MGALNKLYWRVCRLALCCWEGVSGRLSRSSTILTSFPMYSSLLGKDALGLRRPAGVLNSSLSLRSEFMALFSVETDEIACVPAWFLVSYDRAGEKSHTDSWREDSVGSGVRMPRSLRQNAPTINNPLQHQQKFHTPAP